MLQGYNTVAIAYFVIAGLVLVAAIGGAIYDMWKKRRERLAAKEEREGLKAESLIPPTVTGGETTAALDATLATSNGPKGNGRSGLGTRELRAQEIQERIRRGVCIYCEERSTHRLPQSRTIRPIMDWLYRHLNAIPTNRIVLDVSTRRVLFRDDPAYGEVVALCEHHHSSSRLHWQEYLSGRTRQFARLATEQQSDLLEFERYRLDEMMREEAEDMLKSPSKRKKAPPQDSAAPGKLHVVSKTGSGE